MSVIGLVQSHYREVCYMKSVKNLMGDFNFPDVNWHNHAMNEDASSDCTDFFDVLMTASYLSMLCNQRETTRFSILF